MKMKILLHFPNQNYLIPQVMKALKVPLVPFILKNIKIILHKKIRKNSLFKKKFRKDINGNVIQKGGKQKVSFKDDIKGNFLVEITLYNAKDNCLKRKNYKDYTFKLLAKDKKALNCSDCTIF